MQSEKMLRTEVLDINNMTDLKRLLLSKYKYIIGKSDGEDLSVDIMVDRIVTYYESIIACMPGNVYWIDSKGVMLGCNNNVLKMLDFKNLSEFKGLTFEAMGRIGEWKPEATLSFKQDTLEVASTGKAKLNVEEPAITDSEGKLIYFLSSRVPLFDHNHSVIGVVGISIDITERKKMEIALKEAKEKAEIANKAKTEFLENMRHDIRTPLSGIIGLAEILKTEKNQEKINDFTDWLLQSSKELLRFLNDVLESINVASGEILIVKKTFNLKTLLMQIVKLYRAKSFEKGLYLDCIFDENLPNCIIGDSMRIYRIVLELVCNALKFTKEGHVKIFATLVKLEADKLIVKIEIEDTGVGIPEDKHQEIFVRFKRLAPSYDGIYSGSGLGLFMVKQFVNDLNGKIYIESSVNKGSKFVCFIPMQKALKEEIIEDSFSVNDILLDSALTYRAPMDLDCTGKEFKVLIVEDQFVAGMVVKKMLSDLNCASDVAIDGQMAMDLVKRNNYDLILMDIGLPDTDGYELTKEIRAYEKAHKQHKIPVLALTAHSGIEEKQKCIDASIDAIFTKPLFRQKMHSILEMFIPCYKSQLIDLPIK
jgi:two-component system, OmpR family, aerobic respiration control sensor histidine kinase ArcB